MSPTRYESYIERRKGVQGGEPVLKGTRTPVRAVVVLYYLTYPGDLKEVRRALPHLSEEQIRAALKYYERHREEIDAHIKRHNDAFEQLRKAG